MKQVAWDENEEPIDSTTVTRAPILLGHVRFFFMLLGVKALKAGEIRPQHKILFANGVLQIFSIILSKDIWTIHPNISFQNLILT
jgi:hypothetical protein